VKSEKYFNQTKQLVIKSASGGDPPGPLDIVCFAESKGEEKQQDAGAFRDLN
jgi:hypothetical protein